MLISDILPPLPRRPALIAQETTASFFWRLAEINGWTFGELARHVGGSRQLEDADPRLQEVWLGPVARKRLAQVSGRNLEQLEKALPMLALAGITAKARRQVRVETWPQERLPVQACALCVAGRAERPVWRVGSDAWTVCTRHGRWTGEAEGRFQVGVGQLPEVVEAQVRRQRLERKTGLYARALMADALQVAIYWWQCRQMGSRLVWAGRQDALGVTRAALWAVPMVVYPEAVVVAEAMAVRERQRALGRSFAGGPAGWSTGRWVEWVGERLGMPEEMAEGGHRALEAWLMTHRNMVPVVDRLARPAPPAGYRSIPLRLLEPHATVSRFGALEQVTCLPWRLGEPMTSVSGRVAATRR
ncbi:TniQ family protein [Streptomyces lydicus]|uniref:TniQ family protein n=1 Tax=Streptomyces lydicus TaxID=47763 RepID=UPI0037942DAB